MRRASTAARTRAPRSELAVVATLLMYEDLFDEYRIDRTWFTSPECCTLFDAMTALRNNGETIAIDTVELALDRIGKRGLVRRNIGEMLNDAGDAHTFPVHLREVETLAVTRREADALEDAAERRRRGEVIDLAALAPVAVDNRPRGVIVRRASEIPRVQPRFLWARRVPIGGQTVIAGNGGDGKSTIGLDLAARVTTGGAMPGDADAFFAKPRGVLVLQYEDDPGMISIARLEASGADAERVGFIEGVRERDGTVRLASLDRDLVAIERAIEEYDAQLIIIDPLSAALGPNVDSWKDDAVRRVLSPCNELAMRRGVAVLGILHLGKALERGAVHRVLGSVAFVNNARSVLLTAKDPADEQRRCLAHVKHNWSQRADTLAFRLGDALAWEHESIDINIDDWLAAAKPERERGSKEAKAKARAQLVEDVVRLAGGRIAVDLGRAQVRERMPGVSESTIDRALKASRVVPERTHVGGPWFWTLGEPPNQ